MDFVTQRPSVYRAVPLALFALFVVEIALLIGRHSIWFDESYTVLLVEPHGFAEIAKRTSVDGHPPLFYWIVKPWFSLFGASTVALRVQQSLFMLAGIALWYRFFATRVSPTFARIVLALLVTNPYIVHYAVEGRMYALGILLAAATTLLVTSELRWRWVAYWPLAVAMLYTHYFLAFVIAGQFVWMFVARHKPRLWLVAYGISIIGAFAPWLPHAFAQTQTIVAAGFWIPPVTPSTVVTYFLQVFVHVVDADAYGWLVFPALAAVALVCVLIVRGARARLEQRALLVCLAAVPPLCLFVLSCEPLRPIFHPRYVVFTLPALLALIALGIGELAAHWRRPMFASVLVVQLFGLGVLWQRGGDIRPRFYIMEDIADQLGRPLEGEQPEVVVNGHMEFFDAKAVLRDQRVRILRGSPPVFGGVEAVYHDKPDWVVYDLESVTSRYVWFVESSSNRPYEPPAHWHQVQNHRQGYVQYRLYEVQR